MKKFLGLVTMIVAGILLVSGCGSSASTAAVQTVDPQTWMQAASQPGVTVIDVRTPEEYAAGHVEGAININVEGPSFSSDIAALDKNSAYALYCHSGRRSALAADQMAQAGFTKVTNLKGGIADLQAAGAPVVAS